MDRNPYIRPGLTATRQGIPDPAVEMECWLDRLEEVLASASPEPGALDSYDLLALWGRLQRVRPDLLAQAGGERETVAVAETVARQGKDLARLALTVPNPAAWLEEARTLERAYEEASDPVARSTLAERLLADLDDADLVEYAARRQGMTDRALQEELRACGDWLEENAALFLCAGVHVQAVGMTLRHDLAERDYDLAQTALKYEVILDAAEAAEATLALEGLPLLAHEAVAAALHRFDEERARAAIVVATIAYARSLLRSRRAGRAGEPASVPTILKWAAPDGGTAFLKLPAEGETTLTVHFFTADRDVATGLDAQRAWLAGVPSEVRAAKATFPLAAVEEAEQDLRLEVGPERTIWQPDPA